MEALANNPTLLNALQSKINTLVGKSSGYIESLPQDIQDKIADLSKIQEESLELEMEFRSQVLQLEKKFAKLHCPIYQKRFDLITGKNDVGELKVNSYQ